MRILQAAAVLALSASSACNTPPAASSPREPAPLDRMAWWRQARFGLFVHWGLYAIPAGEWNGRKDYGEWIRTSAHIPLDEYAGLQGRFEAPRFDAREWARLARQAGMGYVVITTKHHDGFCLFRSAQTDWDVEGTPFGRDVMSELAQACRAEGLRIGWYHSIMDWHHPDYLPRRGWETDRPSAGADFERYVDYLRAQVTELLTNYGPIDVMWFDGEWESTWTHEYGRALYQLCRELMPNVIVNNRVDKGRGGMAGLTAGGDWVGDFGTPEQEVPATGLPGVDWETCMTMNRHWGWNRADDQWKSTTELIRTLCDVASKGGNFLLNVGPRADGTFPPRAVERLQGIGRWMDVNAEAIRGTLAGPFERLEWGRCTQKPGPDGDTTLYLHVFDWPADGRLLVPGLGNPVRGARLLADPDRPIAVTREQGSVVLAVGSTATDEAASVVALEVEGDPIVYRAPAIEAASDVLVDELEVRLDPGSPGVRVLYTLDGSDPGPGAREYHRPFRIFDTRTVRAQTWHGEEPVSAIVERRFQRVAPHPAAVTGPLTAGLSCDVYSGDWERLPNFAGLSPVRTETVPVPGVGDPRAERVARRMRGFLDVPAEGVWLFALSSDDGSRLLIDGQVVVDNDGLHAPTEVRGAAPLAAGPHAFEVQWFNRTGGAQLSLSWARAGEPFEPLAAERLRH